MINEAGISLIPSLHRDRESEGVFGGLDCICLDGVLERL